VDGPAVDDLCDGDSTRTVARTERHRAGLLLVQLCIRHKRSWFRTCLEEKKKGKQHEAVYEFSHSATHGFDPIICAHRCIYTRFLSQ